MADPSSSELADRLFEAHVAHELAQWRGEAAPARIGRLLDGFWAWAETTPLTAVVPAEDAALAAERLVLDLELPDRLAAAIGQVADDLVRAEVSRDTRVCDVIDRALFDQGVALSVELESLRAHLLEKLFDSPVFTALASDILYQGIKDYIFSDAGAIRSIPGVSRLIKGSSAVVSRRLPGLEAQVEARVKSYIENNTVRTLAHTRALLLDSLDGPRINDLAEQIWAAVADEPLSVADALAAEDLQRLVDYGLDVWRSLRETEYLGRMLEEGVTAFFTRYGDDSVAELLARVGLDRDALALEGELLAPALLQGLADTGLLERWIRDQLGSFYHSAALADALDAAP